MAIGRICGGIYGDGIVDGLAGIGGRIYEVVAVNAHGVTLKLHHLTLPNHVCSEGYTPGCRFG